MFEKGLWNCGSKRRRIQEFHSYKLITDNTSTCCYGYDIFCTTSIGMDGWMDRWMEGRMDGSIGGWMDERQDGQMDERQDGQMDRWMDGWIDG